MNTGERFEGFEPKVEADHISLLVVWGSGIGIVIGIVVGCFVARALMNAWATGEPLHTRAPPRANAQIGIVEQTLVRNTRRGLDANDAERRNLTRWGWADRAHGVARIPIDSAMDLAADPDFVLRMQSGASAVPPKGTKR
jgi:hypothetical protein